LRNEKHLLAVTGAGERGARHFITDQWTGEQMRMMFKAINCWTLNIA
jgi:hypothetical protein